MQHKRVSRFLRQQDGVSAVEFAILSPLFIFLLLAMIAYGIYLGAAHSVQQLAADTARVAVAGLNDDERVALVRDFLRRNASGYILLRPESMTVYLGTSTKDDNQFEVSIAYDARGLPIWDLYSPLPLPDETIVRSASIRMGGV